MIGNLVRRREKTEDEAPQQNGYSTRRTFARLSFANHMDRLVAGSSCVKLPRTNENADWRGDPAPGRC